MNNFLKNLPENRYRSIYLLPNVFTTSALFSGFYAVVQAMNNEFEIASIAIFLAMLFDGIDGRIARLTNTQSTFGAQYDSLSDMTSFGIAPALVIYEWTLNSLGRLGWLAAFLYVAGTALRLARFNVNNKSILDKKFFQGLPSPAAAAMISGFVWLGVDRNFLIKHDYIAWIAFILTIYAAMAMVSSLPFFSGKSISLENKIPFWWILLIIIAFVLVSSAPPVVLFTFFSLYAISSWFIYVWRLLNAKIGLRKRAAKNQM